MRRVRKLIGHAQAAAPAASLAAESRQALALTYEQQLKLCGSLQKLREMAAASPRNWHRHCARSLGQRDGALAFLCRAAFQLHDEPLAATMRIIAAGLRPPSVAADAPWARESPLPVTAADAAAAARAEREQRRREAASSPAADRSADATPAEPDPPVELETLLAVVPARPFVLSFMLQAGAAATRREACAAFRGLWHHATPAQRAELFGVLRDQLASLPLYGANSAEVLALLTAMVRAPSGTPGLDDDMTSAVVDALAASLGEQNALLADHPNAFVYNSLGGLLDLEGHFLESEAAHASNQPELPTQQAKLDTLKAEVKFTEACQIYKFSAPQTVSAGVLRVSDMRRGVSVASINLYCNNRTVTDVGELKNKWDGVEARQDAPPRAGAGGGALRVHDPDRRRQLPRRVRDLPRAARRRRREAAVPALLAHRHRQARHLQPLRRQRVPVPPLPEHQLREARRLPVQRVRLLQVRALRVHAHRPPVVRRRARHHRGAGAEAFGSDRRRAPQRQQAVRPTLIPQGAPRAPPRAAPRRPLRHHERRRRPVERRRRRRVGSVGCGCGRRVAGGSAADPARAAHPPQDRLARDALRPRVEGRARVALALDADPPPHASSSSATCKAPPPARSRAPPRAADDDALAGGPPSPPSPGTAAAAPVVNRRYDCASAFVLQCLGFFEALASRPVVRAALLRRGLVAELFEHNLGHALRHTQLPATRLLCALSHESADATADTALSSRHASTSASRTTRSCRPTPSSRRRSRSSASSARSRTTCGATASASSSASSSAG